MRGVLGALAVVMFVAAMLASAGGDDTFAIVLLLGAIFIRIDAFDLGKEGK